MTKKASGLDRGGPSNDKRAADREARQLRDAGRLAASRHFRHFLDTS